MGAIKLPLFMFFIPAILTPKVDNFIHADVIQTDGLTQDYSWVDDDYKTFCSKWLVPSTRIVGHSGNLIPFDYQVEFINLIETNQSSTIFKSRQMGLSETLCSYIIWKVFLAAKNGDVYKAVIYSISQQDASDLLLRIELMMRPIFDAKLSGDFLTDSKTEKRFDNGGLLKALPATRGRGNTVDLCVIDESDFISDVDNLLRAIKPALINLGGRLVKITTPNPAGIGPAFDELMSFTNNDPEPVIEAIRSPDADKNYAVLTDNVDDVSRAFMLLHWRAHPNWDDDWANKFKVALDFSDDEWGTEFELQSITAQPLAYKATRENIQGMSYKPHGQRPLYNKVWISIDPVGYGPDQFACSIFGTLDDFNPPLAAKDSQKFNHIFEIGSVVTKGNKSLDPIDHIKSVIELWDESNIRAYEVVIILESNGVGHGYISLIRDAIEQNKFGWDVEFEPKAWGKNKINDYSALSSDCRNNRIHFLPDSPLWGENKHVFKSYDDKGNPHIAARKPFYDDYSDTIAKICAARREDEPIVFLADV